MITVKIPKLIPKEKASVIKVTCGRKFFIGKTANIQWFGDALKKAYGKYSFRNGLYESNMFYPIVEYISKKGIDTVYIDVLFSSDNGYQVLKCELDQLLECYGKPNCLNTSNRPIVPKTSYNEANKEKWLSLNESLNYYKYLKRVES